MLGEAVEQLPVTDGYGREARRLHSRRPAEGKILVIVGVFVRPRNPCRGAGLRGVGVLRRREHRTEHPTEHPRNASGLAVHRPVHRPEHVPAVAARSCRNARGSSPRPPGARSPAHGLAGGSRRPCRRVWAWVAGGWWRSRRAARARREGYGTRSCRSRGAEGRGRQDAAGNAAPSVSRPRRRARSKSWSGSSRRSPRQAHGLRPARDADARAPARARTRGPARARVAIPCGKWQKRWHSSIRQRNGGRSAERERPETLRGLPRAVQQHRPDQVRGVLADRLREGDEQPAARV